MFFKSSKKRWAENTMAIIGYLKLTLYGICASNLKMMLFLKERMDAKECDILSKKYAAFTISNLFGDSNKLILEKDEHIIQKVDHLFKDSIGTVIRNKYPQLIPLITDGILRYYKASNILKKDHLLQPQGEVFNYAKKLDLIQQEGYSAIDDKQFKQFMIGVKHESERDSAIMENLYRR